MTRSENNEQTNSMITDLTEGSVIRQLLIFATPLFIANALQAVYNLVDMVVVGRVIGGAGMSAVSIGGDVLHLLTFLAMGFSSAGQVIIAQFVGGKKNEEIRRLIGTMFTFLSGISILISVLCTVIRHPLLGWLNTPPEAYAYTMAYMMTCVAGLPFIYGYNIVSAILRGMGDSRRPFLFITIAAVLNTILDILFVGFLGLEVFGAALATVIGQAVSFIVSLIYLYRHKEGFGFDFRLSSFRIDREILRDWLALGIPMAIQSAAINMSKVVLTAWINRGGIVYSALSGIYNKTGMVLGIVSHSFTTAGSSMIGQNLGARRYDRIPKILNVVLGISLSISVLGSLLVLLFPKAVCELFTGDAAVLAESSLIIFPIVLNFLGAAVRTRAFSIINGSGNSRLNLLVALIDGMISRIGLAALLGFVLGLGTQGIWYGDALAGFMPFVVGEIFYRRGYWKKK